MPMANKIDLPTNFPEEAAEYILAGGTGLPVQPHPTKAKHWSVRQPTGDYFCHLSYNTKGKLYFHGAPHLIAKIQKKLDFYTSSGKRQLCGCGTPGCAFGCSWRAKDEREESYKAKEEVGDSDWKHLVLLNQTTNLRVEFL